ncbi:MAG: diaminopimelate decarboxylase [Pseudomonadota bacterium]
MSHFDYRDGQLHAEQVPLAEIAEAVGTPFFCYSSGALEAGYRRFAESFAGLDATICYALKANANLALVNTFARLGAGADVVSEGELRRALQAGVPADRIVFAGVGKSAAEMTAGLEAGILQFNVESLPELELLNQVAVARGQRAPVSLRVNPDVDARTHEKISTGKADNKFGIDIDQAPEAARLAAELPGIRLVGLAVHIGSQLTDIAPYRGAFERLIALYKELRAAGLRLERLDLGGGLGIVYRDEAPPPVEAYAQMVRELTGGLAARLIFEPGRLLVGNAGLLVTRVLYVKGSGARSFAVVDAAMNDLIRPTLYDAWHEIKPVKAPESRADGLLYDIVGPICETSDTFAKQRSLPEVESGDLLAICSTGAYGAVMSSSYNMRLLAPEVLVRGADHALVRPRQDYDSLLGQDRLAPWLDLGVRDASRGAA